MKVLLMILALTGACGLEASPAAPDPGLAAAPALVAPDRDPAIIPYPSSTRHLPPRVVGTIDPPDEESFLQLLAFRDAVRSALAGGHIATADLPLVDDLRIRIDVALAPYFE